MAINVDVRIERLIPNTNPEATVLFVAERVIGINADQNGVTEINSIKELLEKTQIIEPDPVVDAEILKAKHELLQIVYLIQAGMRVLLVTDVVAELVDELLYNYRFVTTMIDGATDLTEIIDEIIKKTDTELIVEGTTNTVSVEHAKVTYVDNAGIVGMKTKFENLDLTEAMEEGGILSAMAYLVRKAKVLTDGTPWVPIAGYDNGIITEFVRLIKQVGNIEKGTLLDKGVNPTVLKPGVGAIIVGNNTSLFTKLGEDTNPLAKANITTLAIEIKRALYKIADEMLFKLNNSKTWTLTKLTVENYMGPILNQGGIENYDVKVGLGETMTPEEVRQGIMKVQVNYTPTFAIEEISVTVTITENTDGFLIEVDGGL